MTDRELLGLAAKAAGINAEWKKCASHMDDYELKGECGPFDNNSVWNPLTDDGDALRLAVKLGITDLSLNVGNLLLEHEPECKLTGTEVVRRAIVRAAAEIGKTK